MWSSIYGSLTMLAESLSLHLVPLNVRASFGDPILCFLLQFCSHLLSTVKLIIFLGLAFINGFSYQFAPKHFLILIFFGLNHHLIAIISELFHCPPYEVKISEERTLCRKRFPANLWTKNFFVSTINCMNGPVFYP